MTIKQRSRIDNRKQSKCLAEFQITAVLHFSTRLSLVQIVHGDFKAMGYTCIVEVVLSLHFMDPNIMDDAAIHKLYITLQRLER